MRQLTDVYWRDSQQHVTAYQERVTLLPASTSDLAECGGRGQGNARRAARVRSCPVWGSVVCRMPTAFPVLPPSRLTVLFRRLAPIDRLATPRLRGVRLLRPDPGPGRAL